MRKKERVTRVVYVRHGETDFPLDRIYCDHQEDPPLNGQGVESARRTAKILSRSNIAAVVCSPSLRTRMTAEAIGEFHGVKVEFDERLMERHFGVWEGLYFNEIEQNYPVEYAGWKTNQAAFKPDGGESVYDMLARVRCSVQEVVEGFAGETVVVVSHVGPIRALVCDALTMPLAEYRRLVVEPASMTCVDYGASQNNMIFMNFSTSNAVL